MQGPEVTTHPHVLPKPLGTKGQPLCTLSPNLQPGKPRQRSSISFKVTERVSGGADIQQQGRLLPLGFSPPTCCQQPWVSCPPAPAPHPLLGQSAGNGPLLSTGSCHILPDQPRQTRSSRSSPDLTSDWRPDQSDLPAQAAQWAAKALRPKRAPPTGTAARAGPASPEGPGGSPRGVGRGGRSSHTYQSR